MLVTQIFTCVKMKCNYKNVLDIGLPKQKYCLYVLFLGFIYKNKSPILAFFHSLCFYSSPKLLPVAMIYSFSLLSNISLYVCNSVYFFTCWWASVLNIAFFFFFKKGVVNILCLFSSAAMQEFL